MGARPAGDEVGGQLETKSDQWWLDANTDQARVDAMLSTTLLNLPAPPTANGLGRRSSSITTKTPAEWPSAAISRAKSWPSKLI